MGSGSMGSMTRMMQQMLVYWPVLFEPRNIEDVTSGEVGSDPGYPSLPLLPGNEPLPPHIPGIQSNGTIPWRDKKKLWFLFLQQKLSLSSSFLSTLCF